MKKKVTALFLGLVIAMTMLGACDFNPSEVVVPPPPKGTWAKGDISIIAFEGGYGVEWLEKFAQAFKEATADEETGYEGNNVSITPSVDFNAVNATIEAETNNADIVVTLGNLFALQNKDKFVDISDVYNYKGEEDTLSVREKMNPLIVDHYNTDDKFYQMPWVNGLAGVIYNKTTLDGLFGAGKYTLPHTTKEWEALLGQVSQKGAAGIIFSHEVGYWDWIKSVWWAQYDGYETFKNFYNGYVPVDANDAVSIKPVKYRKAATEQELLAGKGRLRSYEVIESLVKKEKNYVHKDVLSMSFSQAQDTFAGYPFGPNKTKSAFMVNGDYLANESAAAVLDNNADLRLMKTPVISSIVETLDNKAMTDAELSAVVSAVDSGKTSLEGVSDYDFKRISDARKMVQMNGTGHNMVVLKSSSNVDVAKDFLKFVTTDYSQELYSSTLGGLSMGYGFDGSDLPSASTLAKSTYSEFGNDFIPIAVNDYSPLVYAKGLNAFEWLTEVTLYKGTNTTAGLIEAQEAIIRANFIDYMSVAQ